MDHKFQSLLESLDDTPDVREHYLRAPFGYPGSKSESLEHILPHLPYHDKYVEPFGGSGAVLLARKKSKLEVFNDRYAGVVAFYRCVRDPIKMQQLIDQLQLYLHSREEFIWCKETWEKCTDDVDRASRWYYMTQISFGSKGRYFGRALQPGSSQSGKITCNIPSFGLIHNRLREVTIENLDWRYCFTDYVDHDTVVYCDPPYLGTDYSIYKHKFSEKDHYELCERIFQTDAFIALSGYENHVYAQYPWHHVHSWVVKNMMSSQAVSVTNNQSTKQDYKDVVEHLWIKEST